MLGDLGLLSCNGSFQANMKFLINTVSKTIWLVCLKHVITCNNKTYKFKKSYQEYEVR